jgi:multicomponent Na+:H+ antiporter subunit B
VSTRARAVLGVGSLAGLAALLVWAVAGLPDFGHPRGPYADLAPRIMLDERHVTNAVTGVTFDLRGFDTLGEELILFVAALGATVLLRAQRTERSVQRAEEAEERRRAGGSDTADALRAFGAVLVGPVLLVGIYIVAHGALTPGGGFQGGVILAGALLLVYAAGQVAAVERVRPVSLVEVADAAGAGAYTLVAVAGLVLGVAAMDNVLPTGTAGSLLSGGTVPVLSIAVGVEVTAAVTLILSEFVDQTMLRGGGRGGEG